MKKLLTRREILVLFKGLMNVTTLHGVKFAYAVTRNIDKLRPLVIEISKHASPPEDYWKYQTEYREIVDKYSDKDNPSKKEIRAEIEKLNEKYEKTLKEADKKQKKVEKYLEEKVEVDIHMIPIEVFPEDIDSKKLEPIMAMIE